MSLPKHLGTPTAHDGAFGAAELLIAEVQGADRAIMSVTGSSGSNQAVVLMLARLAPDTVVLVARNAHHSTINALVAFGVAFEFLPAGYDHEFEALLPPTAAEVAAALRKRPDARAVWLTSPTYEGLAARIEDIAGVVHADDATRILIVDEAWGAHLAFHEALPRPALACGADLVVQSTHKQGGSLQQTGVILWNEARIDSNLIVDAHAQWTTTSPSFQLLASIDAAHRELATRGHELLEGSIERTEHLNVQVVEFVPGLRRFATPERLETLSERVAGYDHTKTCFALTEFVPSGHDLADRLISEHSITVEKSGLNTVMFLTPFQLPEGAEERVARAMAAELNGRERNTARSLPPDPFATLATAAEVSPSRAARLAVRDGARIATADAVGRVCAETVEAYPPGIPVLLPGFPVTAQAVEYLTAVRACGGTIHGEDPTLRTIRVISQP
jgi:arginine decarboxylase